MRDSRCIDKVRDNDVQSLVLLGVVVLVGALLRTWHIGSKSLWIDEAFSVWIARQSLSEALSWLVRIDQHPPLYYLLLHYWMTLFGDSEAVVRSLMKVV